MHIHGGNIYKASQIYGIKAEDILDYSTNINPLEICGEYFKKTTGWLKEEKERFYRELSNIKGLKVFEPQTNFILIKILLPSLDAGTLKDRMGKKGILIRDASNFRFLNDKFFRIAIKDRKSNIIFQSLLKEVMESAG